MALSGHMGLHLSEARRQVGLIRRDLSALRNPDVGTNPLDRMTRAAHAMKGICHEIGCPQTSETADKMETLLASLRQGIVSASPEVYKLLSEWTDVLQGHLETVAQGQIGGTRPNS